MKRPQQTILKSKVSTWTGTVATWAQEYMLHFFPRVSISQQRIAEANLRRFALFMGHREISGQLIHEFVDAQFARKVKPITISMLVVSVRLFLKWSEETGRLDRRYSTLLAPIKFVAKEPVMFTPDQYDRLKEVAKGTVWHYASIMAYRTGARISDVAMMKWEHIDFENLYIRYIPFKSRKTGRYATCPFQAGGDLHEVLKELDNSRSQLPHWDKFACAELAMRYPADGSGGMKTQDFKKLCIKIGAPNLSFHGLRHSAMSRLVNSGTSFPIASQITGLAGYSTFMRYAKPDIGTLRAAMERVELNDMPPQDAQILALPAPAA